jgi:hypothetical protein
MSIDWHAQIQRYIDGQASAREAAALQGAMKENSDLRALYLDHMNLDVALGAAAELATTAERGVGRQTAFPRLSAPTSSHPRRWLAATAAGLALVAFSGWLRYRAPSPANTDVITACTVTEEAIARLSAESPAAFPTWVSPTASMLDQPPIPQGDL